MRNKIALCALLLSANAMADDQIRHTAMNYDRYPWSLGLDGKYMHADVNSDFRPLLSENRGGGSVFLNFRPGPTFDYELGFSWTTRDPKRLIVSPGTVVLGIAATNNATHLSRLRFEDTYFDIHANLPMTKYVEFKLGAGVGVVRQKFSFTNEPSNPNDPLQNALVNLEGRSTITLRFGLGLQTLMVDRLGIRLMFNYETTRNILIKNAPPNVDARIIGNSYTALLGVFWLFNGD